mgnify:CR=1 FL=1
MNFIKVHLPIIKNLMPTTINNNPNNLETKFWPNAIPKLAPKNDMIKIPIPIMDATLKSTSPFLKYLKTAKKLTGSSIEARDVPIDLLKGYFKINPFKNVYLVETSMDRNSSGSLCINEDIASKPELVGTQYALLSAAWFFSKNCLKKCVDAYKKCPYCNVGF